MDNYIEQYGYLAVLIGTMLEGGTLLTMAGFAAHQGYLKLIPWVIMAGFAGNFIDTLIFYYIGRMSGTAFIDKRPQWKPRVEKLLDWLGRYRTWVIVGIRFIPTFRTAGALAIGMGKVPQVQFIFLNAVGAFLWASTIGCVSYLFGHLLELIMGEIRHYELPIFAGIILIGATLFVLFYKRKK